MLEMIGHVRLVRVPQTDEEPAVLREAPRPAVTRPVSCVSEEREPPPTSPAAPEPRSTAPAPEGVPFAAIPQDPPPLPDGAMELQVLGPPRLIDSSGDEVELGAPELEMLARLALDQGRTFSSEELRADMGAAKKTDLAPTTLYTRASAIRRVIGADRMPPSQKAGGYKVVGISTDVARFEAAVARSKTEPADAAQHLAEALSLVRGAPFDGVAVGTFTWASDAGGTGTRLTNKVYDVAVELARAALATGDAALATWAIDRGRLVARDDELLDELELDVAASMPGRSALARAWRAMNDRYRARKKQVPGHLADHYHELRGDDTL